MKLSLGSLKLNNYSLSSKETD